MRLTLPLVVALGLIYATTVSAATLYLKAAGGNWSEAATWSNTGSGGADSSGPPTSADAVILEAGSGNVVVDMTGQSALSVSMTAGTGDYAGTMSCAGNWPLVLARTTTATIWQASGAATLSLSGCLINLTGPGTGQTLTFAGGGKSYGQIGIGSTAAGTVAITGANTFEVLSLAAGVPPSGDPVVTLPAATTTTVGDLQTDAVAGVFGHPFHLQSDTMGMPTTITKTNGTINALSLVVADTTVTGNTTWCDGSAGGDGGGNTGWSFTACPLVPRQLVLGVP